MWPGSLDICSRGSFACDFLAGPYAAKHDRVINPRGRKRWCKCLAATRSHVIPVNIMWRDLISREDTPPEDVNDMHALFRFGFFSFCDCLERRPLRLEQRNPPTDQAVISRSSVVGGSDCWNSFIWRNHTTSNVPLSYRYCIKRELFAQIKPKAEFRLIQQTHGRKNRPVKHVFSKSFKPCLAAPACNRRRQDKTLGTAQCLAHAGPFSMETYLHPSVRVEITYVGNLCGFFDVEGWAFPREEKEKERAREGELTFRRCLCCFSPQSSLTDFYRKCFQP